VVPARAIFVKAPPSALGTRDATLRDRHLNVHIYSAQRVLDIGMFTDTLLFLANGRGAGESGRLVACEVDPYVNFAQTLVVPRSATTKIRFK